MPKKAEVKPAPAPTPVAKKVEAKPVDLGALAASLPQAKPSKAKPAAKPFDLAALTADCPKAPAPRTAAPRRRSNGQPRPGASPDRATRWGR